MQIHGKLKKPVLMRRSGLGPIRNSTTQPMSKQEAASMHVSQVPLGIPVTAVDSDGEEEADRGDDGEQDNLVDAYLDDDDDNIASPNPGAADAGRNFLAAGVGKGGLMPSAPQNESGRQANGLGISTPPLSDENHANRHARQISTSSSSSDDSDTRLPWARSSTSSSNKSSRVQSTEYTHETSLNHPAMNQRLAQLHHQKMDPHQLPPSPISSAESPIYPRNDTTVPPTPEFAREVKNINSKTSHSTNRNRPAGQGHTSNQSSIATTNTSSASESDDESQRRRDQTFSIYDVYGRDSVAFPNFEFRNLNNRSPRIGNSKSNDSLGRMSKKSPVLQSMAMRGFNGPTPMNNGITRNREESASKNTSTLIPAALRSPSGRRPTAAPAPPSIASTLRRKVEANASASSPVTSSPSTTPNMSQLNDGRPDSGTFRQTPTQQHTTMAAFDPTRRPSMGSRFAPRNNTEPAANSRPGVITSSDLGALPQSPVLTTSPADMIPAQDMQTPQRQGAPLGANLLARRMQEASLSNRSAPPSGPLRVETAPIPTIDGPRGSSIDTARSPGRMAASSDETIGRNSEGVRPPIRSSSDRSSSSMPNGPGRIGSGQLRKNPSNPQPGVFGGMTGLVAPQPPYVNANGYNSNGGLSTPTGSSRSPSPLSVPSPSSPHMNQSSMASPRMGSGRMQMPPSPVGSMTSRFPEPRVLSNAGSFKGFHGINPAALQFEPLGFVMGPKMFTMPLPTEDAEEVEKWRQTITENDVVAAKKSRKVKKMVHAGIPHSMRKMAWPFLASSHVRRRAGLFEELCKTSQSVKGKKGKESLYDAIDKDLDRAFPDHRLFIGEGSTGRADLEAILKAYVHYNPIVGYTQGMSLVAGFLLIQMPAEEAFWMLCALLRDVHMEGYYADNMKQLHVDGIVFGQLLQTMDPELAERLMELKIEPINFAPSWLLPLFTRIVPWATLLRLWDIFLFEGPSFLLRTALAVIRIIRDPLMDRRVCPEGGEALRLLLHPPQHLLTPENVIPCALSVKLKDGEVRKLSRQASKLVRSSISTRGAGTNSQGAAPPHSGRKS